jgi:hypothetical protein
MSDDLERFYAILSRLEKHSGQGRKLSECTARWPWPSRGVYFFREPGEGRRERPDVMRVVRVGTHALRLRSRSTLWGRLRAHRGPTGGGNHRASIFRLHVGAALLARDGLSLSTWGGGTSASKEIRLVEADHEGRVSEHIGRMSVLWLDILDDPGPKSVRSSIERNAISLLSNRLHPTDAPNATWLGRHSPDERIRRSGLWNLDHVNDSHDVAFLELMGKLTDTQHMR